MSELEQEMTRAELTRNTLDADTQTLERVADAIAATAATVAGLAQNNKQLELLQVVEYCLWQISEQVQEPLESLQRLATRYGNERTLTEAAEAITARHTTTH